jgi:GT2 family glycosyltransferase
MKERIVILGFLSHFPVAGVAWQTIHYLVGFQRLGYDVYYVEAHGCTPSKLMQSAVDDGPVRAAEHIAALMRRFDLGERWAYHAVYDSRCFGLSEERLRELYRSAALIINLHGSHLPTPELTATNRLVYLGTDPVDIEIDVFHQRQEALDYLRPHCAFFSYGENLGQPDCLVPNPEPFRFHATRQPVVLEFWEDQGTGDAAVFTTIGNWRQPWREVVFKGVTYRWSKHFEFLKFLELPRRVSQPFELALSSCETEDRALLEQHGWRVRSGLELSQDLDAYRRYLGQSRGEFTVAKDQNIRLRSGWFSDRAATYLACGRPVITQETGFSHILPTGEGLFAFSTLDDIVAAVEAINADYARHRRAARAIARECFSHEIVLGRMLETLGLAPRPQAQRHPRTQRGLSLSPDLVIVPVSRWPTRLPVETLQAIAALPLPKVGAAEEQSVSGEEAESQRTRCTSKLAVSPWVARVGPHSATSSEPAPARRAGDSAPYLHQQLRDARQRTETTSGTSATRASVIMVTRDGLPYTKLCLTHLLSQGWGSVDELIVVDNGSRDGTPEFLRALTARHAFVQVICNAENRGFAAACNQGLNLARGELLVLLNNDTLPARGWRQRLARWLEDDAIGIVGPVTNRTCNEAQIDAPYRTLGEMERFAEDYTRQHGGQTGDIPMLAMFCLALRRGVFLEVGPLDEQFEVGMFEDDDYARRVRQAGYRVICAEDVFVHHLGQATFGELCATGDYDRVFEANRRRFEAKWGLSWQPHGRRLTPEYRQLRDRVRAAVAAHLPPSATVSVISKGDDDLLRLEGRQGWHYPTAADGSFANLYPADSAQAIEQLEIQRRRGAGYLLIPQPAFWWLDHYAGFRAHLESQYRVAHRDEATCLVFDLGGRHA